MPLAKNNTKEPEILEGEIVEPKEKTDGPIIDAKFVEDEGLKEKAIREQENIEEKYKLWTNGELDQDKFLEFLHKEEAKTRSKETVKLIHEMREKLEAGADLQVENVETEEQPKNVNVIDEYKKFNETLNQDKARAEQAKQKIEAQKERMEKLEKEGNKPESLEVVREKQKAFNDAAQKIIDAENSLKKCKKDEKKLGSLWTKLKVGA